MNKYILIIVLSLMIFFSCKKEEYQNNDNFIATLSLIDGDNEYVAEISKNNINLVLPTEIDTKKLKASVTISDNANVIPDINTIDNWFNIKTIKVVSSSGKANVYNLSISQEKSCESVILANQKDVNEFAKRGVNVVNGNLIIGNNLSNDSITDLSKLNTLNKVEYNIVINSNYVGKDLKGLENIKEIGALIIYRNKLEKLELSLLETIKSDLIIDNNFYIKELRLEKLSYIGGDLNIKSCQNIEKVIFSNLKKVNKGIEINMCPNMKGLVISKLEKINNDIIISDCELLGTIKIPELKILNSNLNICNTGIIEINLDKLVSSLGSIKIESCNYLEEISIPMLKEVAGTLSIGYLDEVRKLEIPLLEKVNKLKLASLYEVTEINLSKLKTTNDLLLKNLDKYSNLDFLPAMTKCKNLKIMWNKKITNLDGLINIKGIETLKCEDNNNLKDYCGLDMNNLKECKMKYNEYNPSLDDLKSGKCSK